MTTIIPREEVGPRDVLFSDNQHLYNRRHIGNRRYRRIIHLFLSKYAQVPETSRGKSEVAREIYDILMGSGYRFFMKKKDNDNCHYINNEKEIIEKVEFSLHYELSKLSPALTRRRQKELTLEELMGGKLSIVDYVEYLVAMDQYVNQYDNCTIEPIIPVKDQRNARKEKVEVRIDESTSAQAPSKRKKLALEESRQEIRREQSSETSEHCIRFIDDIVESTIACNTLPVAGSWKFYPLQELGNVVDLGTDQEGWQLHLQPILHDTDPISFDVPSKNN